MDKELRDKIVNQEPLNQAYASSDFAQGIERGRFMERDRIIKLLEENCECDTDSRCCPCGHVALIKGENK